MLALPSSTTSTTKRHAGLLRIAHPLTVGPAAFLLYATTYGYTYAKSLQTYSLTHYSDNAAEQLSTQPYQRSTTSHNAIRSSEAQAAVQQPDANERCQTSTTHFTNSYNE